MSFSDGSVVKNPPANACSISEWGDPLEKEMATHSAIFAWEISWTERAGGLQSVESQKSQTQLWWLNDNKNPIQYLVNT